jgi:cephalosporin-C deacetylase
VPLTDMALDELRGYRPQVAEPGDFDEFWSQTLAQARASGGEVVAEPVADSLLTTVDVWDVRFPGWAGEPVAAWLIAPRGARGPLPVVVQYIGYHGGRGVPLDHLLFPSAGYAHLVVDSRGQGHDTPDRDEGSATQWVEGFMTRGIDHPRNHYYRRLMTDCVRAVDAVRELPNVDVDRVVVAGGSQGGGLSLAVAGLAPDQVKAALIDVPFLCHFRRGVDVASEGPYLEIAYFLRRHSPDKAEQTFATLNYFDGMHFAARATGPALFSVALMDTVCPPSTGFAVYHQYKGAGEMRAWGYGDHGGGYSAHHREQLLWLRGLGLGGEVSPSG